MKKFYLIPLLLVLLVLSTSAAFAQATGSVKGVCKDAEGKLITGAEVEWYASETGRKYNLKTNAKGEYFSLGISPGKDRKSTRLNSSHSQISYAVFCLKKKK